MHLAGRAVVDGVAGEQADVRRELQVEPVRLSAEDNERGCSFEFHVPGQETGLAGQAELRVQPEETLSVPVHITPLVRRNKVTRTEYGVACRSRS